MNVDRRRKYFIVLDVETANVIDKYNDSLVYDLGFAIYDKTGHEYEAYSLVITDIFDGMQELMETAYFNWKLPQYYTELDEDLRQRMTIFQARRLIKEKMQEYGITEVYAYNANFDLTALNNTVRYISKSLIRYFFPYGTQIYCIWHMACQVICTQKTFIKQGITNDNGNLITNAERVFAYITGNDFQEEHTGLEDTRVEAQILIRCIRQHKSCDKTINRQCWQIPNKVKKERGL